MSSPGPICSVLARTLALSFGRWRPRAQPLGHLQNPQGSPSTGRSLPETLGGCDGLATKILCKYREYARTRVIIVVILKDLPDWPGMLAQSFIGAWFRVRSGCSGPFLDFRLVRAVFQDLGFIQIYQCLMYGWFRLYLGFIQGCDNLGFLLFGKGFCLRLDTRQITENKLG